MLELFDTYALLFKSWRVICYEQEGEACLLQLSALLQDDSRLEKTQKPPSTTNFDDLLHFNCVIVGPVI